MPIGVPMSTASSVRSRLPMIGLSSPPAAPGGGVISVKTLSESPLSPFHNSSPRISTSQPRPNAVAVSDRPIAIPLRRRRAAYSLFMALTDPPLDAKQHIAMRGEHDKGDAEENETQRDQRRGVEIADRLGEFVGDGRRDGGAGGEDRCRNSVRIADHEGHRHGLAQRVSAGLIHDA